MRSDDPQPARDPPPKEKVSSHRMRRLSFLPPGMYLGSIIPTGREGIQRALGWAVVTTSVIAIIINTVVEFLQGLEGPHSDLALPMSQSESLAISRRNRLVRRLNDLWGVTFGVWFGVGLSFGRDVVEPLFLFYFAVYGMIFYIQWHDAHVVDPSRRFVQKDEAD